MMKFLVTAMIAVSCTVAFAKPKPTTRKPSSPARNVYYGGDAEYDACGGNGVVLATVVATAYDKNGAEVFEKIEAGTWVASCDSKTEDKEEYIGVVFGKKGQDCGTSGPIKDRKEYKGPCKSGWIKSVFFELLAG